jgi:hypothetical protein
MYVAKNCTKGLLVVTWIGTCIRKLASEWHGACLPEFQNRRLSTQHLHALYRRVIARMVMYRLGLAYTGSSKAGRYVDRQSRL